MTTNVKAALTDSLLSSGPGAIKFNGDGIGFNCPCGCGLRGYLPFRDENNLHPSWIWDGNREEPTLTPSVFNSGWPCQWHGWLRAGRWVSA